MKQTMWQSRREQEPLLINFFHWIRWSDLGIGGVGDSKAITGKPDPKHVSTSLVESHNQKIRQHMRRFTRLTAGHSKKFANHCHALALYFAFYNFVKVHSAKRMSPAMAAGIETRLWEMKDIVAYMDAREPKPAQRGTYKKRTEISK